MYNYLTKYEYDCPQCKKSVETYSEPKKCKKCSIELCDSCYEKDHHICAWCYDKVDDEILWKKKITKYLMLIVPLLIFLLPAPIPVFILLIISFNLPLLLAIFLLIGTSDGILFLIWYRYRKKIIS